ncbi:vWA domain-containing protein [Pseudodesulfovibrio sp. zrk46]|uniref:vWA domain-containing protein n=1 Tax=Pseudodesulfovibrio sp. zrk46 TaxID=2725288 RepID=UPI0014496AFB|nr:vWA domain-containing protein [Pseudodesulfovibrio sp. zrk46]QJB56894.1 VWA domain-containing protein [Pseudodesulfovibrio sp. zrk46]
MRRKSRELDIFSLSFLDVFACALGATILLVLVSNFTKSNAAVSATEGIEDKLELILSEEKRLQGLEQLLAEKKQGLSDSQLLLQRLKQFLADQKMGIGATNQELEKLMEENEGLALVQSSLKKAAAIRPNSATVRDKEEVGGIPVDSEYIIFIIDTSGSMMAIWPRVLREMEHILEIHPQVKGFQVMNDNGFLALVGYQGKWIPDSKSRRRAILKRLNNWQRASNSSPVEGLEKALRQYAHKATSLSIYIIGDDYSGAAFDQVLSTINRLNRSGNNGKRQAKIHAVGFLSNNTTGRFPVLMTEVTRQNGGTFIALPR